MRTETRCRICVSRKREEVDRGILAGRSAREIAKQFAFSKSGVDRHTAHIEKPVVNPRDEIAKVDALLEEAIRNPLLSDEDVYAAGRTFRDAFLRLGKSVLADNPKLAGEMLDRANRVLEMFAKGFGIVQGDARPTSVTNIDARVIAVLESKSLPELEALLPSAATHGGALVGLPAASLDGQSTQ